MFQQIAFTAALLVLPQGSAAQAHSGGPTPGVTGDVHQLMEAVLAAEQRPDQPAPDELLAALQAGEPQLAARAAYAAGLLRAEQAVTQLIELADSHQDLTVRRQALAAMGAIHDERFIDVTIRTLNHEDRTLRTLAANNLGQLRARSAIDPLLALVAREAVDGADAADKVAAIVALTDIDARDSMLPAAGAVQADQRALGAALAYMFQTLGARLSPDEEAVTLVAALPHPCRVLRRHSIQRLGELRAPATMSALEGRLATEPDAGLRQLVEVSLQAIRGPVASAEEPAVLTSLMAGWRRMNPTQRAMVAAVGAGTSMLVGAFFFWRARRRRALLAVQWAAMTAPSEEFSEAALDHFTPEPGPPAFENEPDYVDATPVAVDHQFDPWGDSDRP